MASSIPLADAPLQEDSDAFALAPRRKISVFSARRFALASTGIMLVCSPGPHEHVRHPEVTGMCITTVAERLPCLPEFPRAWEIEPTFISQSLYNNARSSGCDGLMVVLF